MYIFVEIMFIWMFRNSYLFKVGFMWINFDNVFSLLQRNSVFTELHKLCRRSHLFYVLIHWFLANSCKANAFLARFLQSEYIPCKILARILQEMHLLARSCKKCIYLQDLARNAFFARILQDPCKECNKRQIGFLNSYKNEHSIAIRRGVRRGCLLSTKFLYICQWGFGRVLWQM